MQQPNTNMKNMTMTPEQKLKHAIILHAVLFDDEIELPEITAENIDEVYESLDETNSAVGDARSEIRETGAESGVKCESFSRNYEAEEVAAQMPDGSWVGWTHWHGGGKHGEPEAMPWMENAYNLACEEKEVMTTVRTFTRA